MDDWRWTHWHAPKLVVRLIGLLWLAGPASVLSGCSFDETAPPLVEQDGGDATVNDTGRVDGGQTDGGQSDGGADDGGPDAAQPDTGVPDVDVPADAGDTGDAGCADSDGRPGAAEVCDGVDNNCDGTVDEGCDCVNDDTRSCYDGPAGTESIGVCQVGTQTCVDGAWGSCDGQVTPESTESCADALDNDCDGVANEGCQCDFDAGSTGVCADAQIGDDGVCAAPAGYEADETLCDQLDNDCDGITDEGCACDFDQTSTGVCASGTISQTDTCEPPADYQADETLCDQLDNDCDGVTDEGCPCNYDDLATGVCTDATIDPTGTCQPPSTYHAQEQCDGVDDNCDGRIDEGCNCTSGTSRNCYQGADATEGVGPCHGGTQTCVGGAWDACQGQRLPANSDDCADQVDNNCNGSVNEGCCVGLDVDSAVTTTSGCLTAGTGAQAAVAVDLVDNDGAPVTGADVTMTTTAGSLSAVTESANTYWAVLTAPTASGTSAATVTVSATDTCSGQSVEMTTQVDVAVARPVDDNAGGAGGCGGDGNLRVRVVRAEDDTPLAGARVMVGGQQQTSSYTTTFGATPSAPNTAQTDADGYASFQDFGAALDGPQTVTAGAAGRAYLTMVDVDAADLVLPVEQIDPTRATRTFDGAFSGIDTGGDIDAGFMLSDVTIDQIMDFNLDTLLSDNTCYASGVGYIGDLSLPGNVFLPSQSVIIVGLNQKDYVSTPIGYGEHHLTGLSGETSVQAAGGGDVIGILKNFDFQTIGSHTETVDANTTTGGVDIAMSQGLNSNVSCDISNAPADSDVFCLTAGDWDSKVDAGTPVGAGQLFLMGLRIADSSAESASFTIDNVTTVADTAGFSDIQYMGATVATYLDQNPAPPAGTADGTTIIARRDPAVIDAAGGTLSFDDYLPIRPLSRNGRQFQVDSANNPAAAAVDFTRTTIRQAVNQSYAACAPADSQRTTYHTLWTVYTDGQATAYQLPTLPAGWPRQGAGGFVDPGQTPEDDVVNWMHMSVREGLNSGFDYNRLRFGDIRQYVTHAAINDQDF